MSDNAKSQDLVNEELQENTSNEANSDYISPKNENFNKNNGFPETQPENQHDLDNFKQFSAYATQEELSAQYKSKDLNKNPLKIAFAVIMVILLLLAFAGSDWSKDLRGVNYDNQEVQSAKSQAQDIMRAGQKQTNIAKIAAKKHQETIEAAEIAKKQQELALSKQKQLAVIQELAQKLKNASTNEVEAILKEYGITDPLAIAEIKRRLANGEPIDQILAEVLEKSFVDLTNPNIAAQIIERVKNGENIEQVLTDLGFIDPKIKTEILERLANGEKLADILASLSADNSNNLNAQTDLSQKTQELAQKLKNASTNEVEAILKEYGITDPLAIAEIKRRLANGEPIDDVLTQVLAQNGSNSAEASSNLTNSVKSKHEPLDIEQNDAIKAEIAQRIKNGENLLDIEAAITERNNIAKRLAAGEDAAAVMAEYGITDPLAIAEIKRRLANGEPIDQILADVAQKFGQGSKLSELYGIKNGKNPAYQNGANASYDKQFQQLTRELSAEEIEERQALREAIKQKKMQLFEQALTAKVTLDLKEANQAKPDFMPAAPSAKISTSGDELANVQAELAAQEEEASKQRQMLDKMMQMQLNQLEGGASIAPMRNNPSSQTTSSNNAMGEYAYVGANPIPAGYQAQKANFANNDFELLSVVDDNEKETSRWDLGQTLQTPKSKYTVLAGWTIPATMISGINSDLPGQVIGQVSQNVYDSATGKYLLI